MSEQKRTTTVIVDVDQLLSSQQRHSEQVNFFKLLPLLADPHKCLEWLACRKLIKNSKQCENCDQPASLIGCNKGIDDKQWKCNTCGFISSVRKGSMFETSPLTLQQIIIITYFWAINRPQNFITHQAGVSSETVADWIRFCQDECAHWVDKNPLQVGGFDSDGKSIVVEIGESNYFHEKYHVDQRLEGRWIFGGVERGSGKCFLVELPDRKTETLECKILEHILPGSHVVSDGWCAYANIDQLENGIYMHSMILQENSNLMENMWLRVKRQLRKQLDSTCPSFMTYLKEFVWRNLFHNQNLFIQFLICVSESYEV